jgi:AcrR family transcriptional regulator
MRKGEETKQSILLHAARLASRIGLEAMTIGHLAEDLAMSKSGLFAHFGSKETLQLEVLEFTAQMFLEEVVRPAFQEEPGLPRIRALFEHWLRWAETNFEGGCPYVQATVEFDDRPGPVRDLLEVRQREWLEGLAESARRAKMAGHFGEDLDPDQFAFEFYSLLLGYHHAARMLHDPQAEARVRRAVDQLLDHCR